MKTISWFCQAVGVIIVCAVLFSIPILTACSYCLGWNNYAQWAFTFASIIEFVVGTLAAMFFLFEELL